MTYIGLDKETGLYVTPNGLVLKPVSQWKDKDGYCYVTVNRKNIAVHRMVAKAFVDGRSEKRNIVMHKDDNPANNNANNLSWGTYSENNYDAYRHGLRTQNIAVRCMETGEEFYSGREAAIRMFGIPKRGDRILRACRGKRGTAYGFHWEVVSR